MSYFHLSLSLSFSPALSLTLSTSLEINDIMSSVMESSPCPFLSFPATKMCPWQGDDNTGRNAVKLYLGLTRSGMTYTVEAVQADDKTLHSHEAASLNFPASNSSAFYCISVKLDSACGSFPPVFPSGAVVPRIILAQVLPTPITLVVSHIVTAIYLKALKSNIKVN